MDDGEIFIEAREVKYAGMSTGAMHLYLVYRDTDGEEYVIRSGPQSSYLPFFGNMKIETNVSMEDSADDRGSDSPQDRLSTPLDFPGLTDDEAWAIMVKYARMIDAADTSYELFEENSNAFVGALLEAAGLDAENPDAWLPEGIEASETVGLSSYDDLMAKVAPPADGTVRGTAGADQITGIQIDEVIQALAGDDTVWAGRGDDQVFGGAGNDRIYGQAGCDRITGGTGTDTMYAGAGDGAPDVFVFASKDESPVGSKRDVIHEFTPHASAADPAGDVIDLSGIDANTRKWAPGNDALQFGGTSAGKNAVWYAKGAGEVILRGDVNGDAKADFEIRLMGVSSLTVEDFVL